MPVNYFINIQHFLIALLFKANLFKNCLAEGFLTKDSYSIVFHVCNFLIKRGRDCGLQADALENLSPF